MSRTRSTTLIDEPQGPFTLNIYSDTALLSTATYNWQHTRVKTIVDVVTPGYYDKLSNGEFLPVNSVSISDIEEYITPHTGSANLTHTGVSSGVTNHSGSYVSNYGRNLLPGYTPSSSEIDYAVIQALSKAKAPDFDALTFAAEFKQTASLLAGTYKRLFRFTEKIARRAARRQRRKSIRRKAPFDSKKALSDFGQLWLEARYGWRPLLYDIEDILKVLKHKSQTGISRRSYRYTVPISDIPPPETGEYPGVITYSTQKSKTGECRIRAVVFHKSDMSPIGANPILTIWEVTKYSFVIDWFIDIGGWLQAVTPRIGYNELGVSVSWAAEYTDTCVTTLGTSAPWNNGYAPQTLTRVSKRYERSEYSGLPLPSIHINLNKFKVVDLIFLVLQHQKKMAGILRL